MSTSRRDFITATMGMGAGALLASCSTRNMGTLLGPEYANANASVVPWPYTPLDPKVTADRSYDIYWERHCMCAPFEAIVAQLGQMHGEPFTTFPFKMLEYGAGGIAVSTVCGCMNGSAMTFGLFVENADDRNALITDLFHWYDQTALPDYVPPAPKNDVTIAKSVAGSNLCHVSVSNWCSESGLSAYATERKERCGRLCGSVGEKLVTMLNDYFAGSFVAAYPLSGESETCRGCHDKGGMLENTRANMDCMSCHDSHM